MAKSWADMSKEERSKYDSKKAYNKSTGQGKHAETESSSSSSSTHTNSSGGTYTGPMTSAMQSSLDKKEAEKQQEAARIEAKEKASSYLANHENAGKGGTRDAGFDAILKEGGLTNHQYQQMVNADKKIQYDAAQEFREESNAAYNQSRKDIQAVKAEHGPKGIYDRQSAASNYDKNPLEFVDNPTESATDRDNDAVRRALEESGFDYNHFEIQRHKNAGKYQANSDYLYDAYGGGREGYQNWYDNYSIYGGDNGQNTSDYWSDYTSDGRKKKDTDYEYSTGNFQGSKDIMDLDKVLEIGRNQQDAIKNYQTSSDYMSKYGQYDWAKDYNEKYGQGAN